MRSTDHTPDLSQIHQKVLARFHRYQGAEFKAQPAASIHNTTTSSEPGIPASNPIATSLTPFIIEQPRSSSWNVVTAVIVTTCLLATAAMVVTASGRLVWQPANKVIAEVPVAPAAVKPADTIGEELAPRVTQLIANIDKAEQRVEQRTQSAAENMDRLFSSISNARDQLLVVVQLQNDLRTLIESSAKSFGALDIVLSNPGELSNIAVQRLQLALQPPEPAAPAAKR